MPTLDRPLPDEHAEYYGQYVALVPEGDVLATLERQGIETAAALRKVPAALAKHRYAPGKWSVTEVIGHLSDAERVFTYRALRFARNDTTPLAGFSESDYVPAARFDDRTLPDVAAEYAAVRAATLSLFRGLDPAAWNRRGLANDQTISVRALAFVLAGHELHHLRVLRERYGLA